MKNKLISIGIIVIFLFASLISTTAAAPSPRVDLNEYEVTTTNPNDVFVSGTVNICAGQNISLFDSTGKMPLNYTTVKDTGSQGSFKIKVPPVFLNEGTNTFKVISLPVRGKVNASSPKTFTVKVKTTKKDQVITANNLTLKVNEKKNINAKVNTNLPLTYKSTKPDIVTVDTKGNVIGRSTGTTQIIINQSGNKEYNAVTRNITVTVKDDTPDSYTITYHANGGKGSMSKQKVKRGQSIKLIKNKFTRKDYTFKGWSTTTNHKVIYKDGQSIKPNKNIILYAVWEKNKNIKAEKIIETCDKLCYVNKGKAGGNGPWNAKNKNTSPRDSARKAFKKRGYKQKIQCADCGYFVSTVIYEVTGKKVKILGGNGRKAYPGGSNSIKKAGFKLISTNKNYDKLKPGDVIRYHKKSGGQHTLIYYGNGRVAEGGRSSKTKLIRWPVIQKGNKKWAKSNVKDFELWRIQD